MRSVFVAGIGMTRFAKQPGRSIKDLIAEAVIGALKDAGYSTRDVQAAYVANAVAGSITGQEMVLGQIALRPLGIGGIPIINVENACASASSAFHLGWQAVAGGAHDVVLVAAAEKLTHREKARSFAAIGGSVDAETIPRDLPTGRSFLMDLYAAAAREYLDETGSTVEDMARVVIKNQRHGALNPLAQYGGVLTIDEVLSARLIVDPFTLLMCSPISDGAAAAVLVSSTSAAPPGVRILASAVRSAPPEGAAKVAKLASEAAYDMASLGPADMDCVEVHDAAASAELMAYEQLGLTTRGGAKEMIRTGQTELGGRVPVNTSGGLLSRGHPIGATGLAQIAEATTQIRGAAGARQVHGARVALTQNAGGWHGRDNVVCVIHILGSA